MDPTKALPGRAFNRVQMGDLLEWAMMAQRPLQIDDLYRLRLVSDAQISPDGSRVAYVVKQMDQEKNDYIGNIYLAEADGSTRQLSSGDQDSSPRWSPDGKYIAFLSARTEHKPQIHLLPMSGGESVALTDRKEGAGVPVWSPDGQSIAFVGVTLTEPEEDDKKDEKKPARTKITERASYKLDGAGYIGNKRRHIFLIDVEQRSCQQLTDGDQHDDSPAWSPDSQHLAFSSNREPRWDVSTRSDIYVVPRTGGQPRQLTSGASYGSPTFSHDGSRIAFIGHEDPDAMFVPGRIYSVDRSGDGLRDELGDWDGNLGDTMVSDVIQSAEAFGTPLFWRPEAIYFLGTVRGESNVYCTDGAVKPVTEGAHTITGFSLADDGTVAYTCSDPTHPAEVFVWDNGQAKQLSHENQAFLEEVYLERPERISFTGANGQESEGWLLAPRGHESGKHPLIIYIHGGPPLSHGEVLFFEYQLLAANGFGVFYPNIHGSSSYGKDYQCSIKADWGNLDYQDVLAGTEAAASRPWVDEKRIGMAGGSYGGYMTSWTISHTDRFQAALAERALVNFVSFFGSSDFGWAWNRICGVYPEEDVQKLWDMSPMKYVANITCPVLVIHSEGDNRTPIEQGEQLFNALRRLGKETKLIVFPEESHGLSRIGKPSRRAERLGYILDWFREQL